MKIEIVCFECKKELFIGEEMIIHRKIDDEHLSFHPPCWNKYLSSLPVSDTAGLINVKNPQSLMRDKGYLILTIMWALLMVYVGFRRADLIVPWVVVAVYAGCKTLELGLNGYRGSSTTARKKDE